jgi:hypothetical protein
VRAAGFLVATVATALLSSGAAAALPGRHATDPAWSTALGTLGKPIGSYRKQTISVKDGDATVLSEEFVDYDLRAKWLDRRLTRAGNNVYGTRQQPALRFVYRPGGVLMWNPNALKKCGTPWVRWPRKAFERITAERLDNVFTLEPESALASLRSKPRVVRRGSGSTTFQVLVNGDVGLPASPDVRAHPEAVAKLHRGTTSAFVRVPKNGPIRISVDITNAVETIGGQSLDHGRAWQVWSLERPSHPLDRSVPRTAANFSCLG